MNGRCRTCSRRWAIDPRMFSAYNGLGAAYKQIGRQDDAVRCWKKALEVNPDSASRWSIWASPIWRWGKRKPRWPPAVLSAEVFQQNQRSGEGFRRAPDRGSQQKTMPKR